MRKFSHIFNTNLNLIPYYHKKCTIVGVFQYIYEYIETYSRKNNILIVVIYVAVWYAEDQWYRH